MLQNFKMHCPTNDETVSLTVNYISARCPEDMRKIPYVRDRIEFCSGYNDDQCNPCKLHSNLPREIFQ